MTIYKTTRFLIFTLLVVLSSSLSAQSFRLVALFPGKAMIEIGEKRILLKAGQTKKGFTLKKTDTFSQTATITIDGKTDVYELGRHIGGSYKEAAVQEVRILKEGGSYKTSGLINGRPVEFIVDTGANKVAMSENQARELGLDYRDDNNRIIAFTASGQTDAWRVTLNNVTIEGISLDGVEGTVVMGDSPRFTLLGMSFLQQLEMRQEDNLMILRQKF